MPDHRAASESRDSPKCILVLPTTHHTLLAEKVLQSVNVRYLTIPKPLKAVSDCGMAIQISGADIEKAAGALRREKMAVDFFLEVSEDEIQPIEPGGGRKENEK